MDFHDQYRYLAIDLSCAVRATFIYVSALVRCNALLFWLALYEFILIFSLVWKSKINKEEP